MGVIQRQGIKNAIISYTGICIGFLSLLIVQPRILSPSEIGLTRLLFSFSSILSTLIPLGMVSATIRFFPMFKNKNKNNYGFFPFVLLITFIGFLFVGALIYVFKKQIIQLYTDKSFLFTIYFEGVFWLAFFLSFSAVISAYCTANLKTTIPSFINDIYLRIASILVFFIYYLKWINLDQMVLLFILIYGTQFVILLLYSYLIEPFRLTIHFSYLRQKNLKMIIEYGLLFAVGLMASMGLRYLDSVILGIYLPLSVVGVYTVCSFIPTIIEIPLTAIEKISNPKIAEFWETGNITQISKVYELSVKILSIVSSIVFLMVLINLKYLLSYLPSQYAQAYHAIIIISLGALINAYTGINNGILYFSKKYKTGLALLLFLLVTTIILDVMLIPFFGINGAAIATSTALSVYNIIKYFYIRYSFKLNPYNFNIIKTIGVLIFLSAVYFFIENLIQSGLFMNIFLSLFFMGIYLWLLLLLKVVHLSELKQIVHLIPGNQLFGLGKKK
jgi:O-antigen/teichoic acid export membrane protein